MLYVSILKFRINFGKGSGLANASFFLKSDPFQEPSRLEESFLLQKHLEEKFKPRSPINSRKIQG